MSRWLTLIRERFPPGSYLPMVVLFFAANAAVAGLGTEALAEHARALVVSLVVVLSYFFRLRLFDEIKDYEVDRQIHPDRPLARGLVSVAEVRPVIHGLALLELALTASLGMGALAVHAAAVLYSYVMYTEFFIGDTLRPHLTTYAVLHTLSSALLGYSVAAQVLAATGSGIGALEPATLHQVLAFGVVNWMLFNIFEFARKSYAPEEERPDVASYSGNFGAWGAVALTLSQVAVALGVIAWAGVLDTLAWHYLATALIALPAAAFGARPRVAVARFYRRAAGVYILMFYLVTAYPLLV